MERQLGYLFISGRAYRFWRAYALCIAQRLGIWSWGSRGEKSVAFRSRSGWGGDGRPRAGECGEARVVERILRGFCAEHGIAEAGVPLFAVD